VTDVRPQGHRRIDRVLSEDYLEGLRALSLEEVRALRAEAEQEEVDLSYLRRLLQGRVDILHAELGRRAGRPVAGETLVDELPHILAEDSRPSARGSGRHSALQPTRTDSHRRHVEALVADVDLADVTARSDDELQAVLTSFHAEEQAVSAKRRLVQDVMDQCSAEITRRYRDGEADVGDLLAGRS